MQVGLPAAAAAALLVGLLVTLQPKFGGLILAIIVFLMLTSGVQKGTIRL